MSSTGMFRPKVSYKAVWSDRKNYQSRWSCWEPAERHLTASCLRSPTTTVIPHMDMGSVSELKLKK